ncbi:MULTISPECIES: helix-turn-helix domain-containing protein [Bacteroides]|jgi:transcriptional regulator with XRE-family HTH domain|uniref:helix-turn-helix domain-containing protein n=1 Tax=Bacteroides TaxID=816 RepID=UPI000E547A61|nr:MULTISPECIES: helix-turn-helix transcriptional regulator [Bacteroides]MCS3198948.1 helix-turn-helix transcriptional regulator [Candidatus Bacteroides intestinigallinarum]QNL39382.1 helix-turn-helix transcriptional regulator [Bacteroides sp. M10]RGQ89601.1 XRE family transcriptional regulator [Bacteroides sp. AF26-7BH]RGY27729.1 XRE family transcriptional regulator [Bacteroides sp. OF02-3LB]
MNLRVKEICKEKGITIQELADNMEMKRESLSRAINGNPTLETLEKIASALGVNISELFDQPKNNTAGITCPHCGKNINIKIE